MPQPADGPATKDQVKVDLSLTTATDDGAIDLVVAAVNALVRSWPVGQVEGDDWPANVTRGANMLAARLFRRRNTPSGVEAFGDLGPVYVMRNDPDVAMLLKLGAYKRPAVG